jgi:hypothetical protein
MILVLACYYFRVNFAKFQVWILYVLSVMLYYECFYSVLVIFTYALLMGEYIFLVGAMSIFFSLSLIFKPSRRNKFAKYQFVQLQMGLCIQLILINLCGCFVFLYLSIYKIITYEFNDFFEIEK